MSSVSPKELEVERSPAGPTPTPRAPRTTLVLSGVALLAVTALVAALFGLVPRRAPEEVASTPFDPARAVAPLRVIAQGPSEGPVNRQQLWSFGVCPAPRDGARLYRLALAPDRDAFAVWCAGEYVLLDVAARAEQPVVSRIARFPARGELPGGAAALDLDGDGVVDLALGVAPARDAVHRPFSGVYFLRGRVQGGFELPRTLVEMPTVALLAADLDAQTGSELVVLTRGDPAAQRPGELWVFAGGTSPRRLAVLPAALAPIDLALGVAGPTHTDLWVVSAQPGSLLRLRLSRDPAGWATAERSVLPLPGVQGFVSGPRDAAQLYVRDALGVHGLAPGATPKLVPFRADARIGPAAWMAGEGEHEQILLGATQRGFAHFEGSGGTPRERGLPEGVRVVDASSVGAATAQPRGVLLVTTAEQAPPQLALVVLPAALRAEASEVALRSASLDTPASAPKVVLE